MPPQKSADHQSASASSIRKAYVVPGVVEYGSLADITLVVGNTGNKDSAVQTATTRTRA